jgi:hypothetical protein
VSWRRWDGGDRPGNVTHGVVTPRRRPFESLLMKQGLSAPAWVENDAGLTWTTCWPRLVVWPDWRLTP